MLFNSFHFLEFFTLVVTLYFFTPVKYRWIFLLCASCFFYMSWNPIYILLLLTSIVVNYYAGIRMGNISEKSSRKKYLWLSVISNLGLLFTFKYYNFINQALSNLLSLFGLTYHIPVINLILPVGISFYTFQTLSYSIDVYRGKRRPEQHFGFFALYVSFFPQLVAGPIERSEKLLPQFYQEHSFDYRRVTDGLKLMLWGFFKKIVIADRLAIVVNTVYSDPSQFSGIQLFIAMIFFAYQLYCDFSGYSDIAIGSAEIMGIQLTENFKQPFFSRTLNEFWGRWHVTLYSWLKDYVTKPVYTVLKFRNKELKRCISIFVTFAVSGIWHGAKWTFVIWGILHGMLLIFGRLTQKTRGMIVKKLMINKPRFLYDGFRIIITFWCMTITAVFFRAQSLTQAFYILKNFTSGIQHWMSVEYIKSNLKSVVLDPYDFYILIVSIILLEIVHIMQYKGISLRSLISRQPLIFRWTLLYILLFWTLLCGEFGNKEFVYFQF